MKCNEFNSSETSDPFHIGTEFGGIPTNLLTNTIGWIIIMTIFLLTRKSPCGVITETLQKNWNRLFVRGMGVADDEGGGGEEEPDVDEIRAEQLESPTSAESSVIGGDDSISVDEMLAVRKRELARRKHNSDEVDGVWNWLRQSFRCITFSDETMFKLAGTDGLMYLRFQKYLIFLIGLTMVMACLLLPINLTGDQYKDVKENRLARTTINNRPGSDPLLIIHTIVSFILFPISIFAMRQFSKGLNFRDISLEITRTLLIENIPKQMCTVDHIKRHFVEAYASPICVSAVTLAYDVSDLEAVAEELRDARSAKKYAQNYKDKNPGTALTMKPKVCSRCCSFFCCCVDRVDVLEYYTEEEVRLEREVARMTEVSLHSPLGIAFVTFDQLQSSKDVFDDFTPSLLNKKNPKLSSLSSSLRPENWRISFAPVARDIHWKNLQDHRGWLTTKKVFADILMLSIALFFTTPEVIVTQLQPLLNVIFGEDALQIPTFVKDFLPTLLLLGVTALMPSIITWSVRWLGHWYKSTENHEVMRRIFWYLWFCIVISPTFGLTTGLAFLEHSLAPNRTSGNSSDDGGIRWNCVGLPDSGAVFINYIITATFIGTSLELLRLPDMICYLVEVCKSKTPANSRSIQRAITYEFRFGEQYAKMLMIFSLVIMISFSSPMITPFGLLYFVLKHIVDKHNLAWIYDPSEIDNNVHRSAINFVIFSMGMLQFYMTVLSLIRNIEHYQESLSWRSTISLILLGLSGVVFFAQAFSQFCKKISPISYVEPIFKDTEDDFSQGNYIPNVLMKAINLNHGETSEPYENHNNSDDKSVSNNQGYGTFVDDLIVTDSQQLL